MASGLMPTYNPTQNMVTVIPAATPEQGQACIAKFLKGEPKALGVVQIMIGIITLLFGIILSVDGINFIVYTGVTIWGSFIYISAGAVSTAAGNKASSCLIKASLTMNVISAVTAGVAIILLTINTAVGSSRFSCYYSYSYDRSYDRSFDRRICESFTSMSQGTSGVLLVLALVQFIISIVLSAFGCQASCNNQPRQMYMIPNQNLQNPVLQNTMMQNVLVPNTMLQCTQIIPPQNAPVFSAPPQNAPPSSLPQPSTSTSVEPLLHEPPPYTSVPSSGEKNLEF